jgi:N-acetylmuramoyl-L-alanine amidase
MPDRRRIAGVAALVAVLLAACTSVASPTQPDASAPPSAAASIPASAPPSAAVGTVEPAPGSDSLVYQPNPAAIVVAIDPGHGGCLDWGVPDPSERGAEWAEKTLTLAIAQSLRDRLVDDGIGVVMIRDADVALAGDDYPDLGCTGPAWRDVDGDGNAGFEESGRIRTRDELQARIDLANLVGADVLVSVHINAITEGDVVYEIAATETFFDDETAWGNTSGDLADALQTGVVDAIEPLATYDREDRGTDAVAFYVISREWQDGDTCETPGDTWCKPHRALQIPGALAEVGSITLRAEHDLLATDEGQDAIAAGLFEGLGAFFGERRLAGRIGLDGERPGALPPDVDGDGPLVEARSVPAGPVRLRLTNTGNEPWPEGVEVVAGWEATELPYLAHAPASVAPLEVEVPALGAGESVVLSAALPAAPDGRAIAWIGLRAGGIDLADEGSAALQLGSQGD